MKQTGIKYSFLTITCIVLLVLSSCSKGKAHNPQKDKSIPVAIRAMIPTGGNCTCEPFANEYKWRNQTVYLFSCRGPTCDCVTLYYDENGQKITMAAGYMPDAFRREARLLREIWRCKE
jgi:hypothetical protein